MKIYCEHCKKDITLETDKMIDNYRVGQIVCPHCNKKQSRYISESDLLLYCGFSELFYLIMSALALYLLDFANNILKLVVIVLPLLIIGYLVQRYLIHSLYEKAYFKEEIKNKVIAENGEEIRKRMNWQNILFFALAITFVTMEENKIFFGIVCILAIILTFIKFILSLKKEKSSS